jgi:tetratricopeptide (TPR) repeat protein
MQQVEDSSTQEINILESSKQNTAELARAYQSRGIVMLNRQKAEQAVEDFTKALSISPQEIYAYLNRATAYKSLSKYDLALEDYAKVEALLKNSTSSHQKALLAQTRRDKSETLMSLGKYQEAISVLTEVLKENPEDETAYNLRAKAHLDKGDPANALTDSHEYVKRNGTHLAYINRGLIRIQTKDYPSALHDLKRALETNKEGALKILPGINKIIGSILVDMGHLSDAIAFFTAAINDKISNNALPSNRPSSSENQGLSELYIMRGNCSYKLGDFKPALEDMTKAIQLDPEQPEGYYARGVILATVNHQEKALVDFDKALQKDPNHEMAKKGRDNMVKLLAEKKA